MIPLQDFPTGPTVVAGSNENVTAASGTAEQVLASARLPGLTAESRVRVSFNSTHTNGANDKIYKVKIDGLVAWTATRTATDGDSQVVTILNKGATNVQATPAGALAAQTSDGALIEITGQKETGGESIVLTDWLVEVIQLPKKIG